MLGFTSLSYGSLPTIRRISNIFVQLTGVGSSSSHGYMAPLATHNITGHGTTISQPQLSPLTSSLLSSYSVTAHVVNTFIPDLSLGMSGLKIEEVQGTMFAWNISPGNITLINRTPLNNNISTKPTILK